MPRKVDFQPPLCDYDSECDIFHCALTLTVTNTVVLKTKLQQTDRYIHEVIIKVLMFIWYYQALTAG